MKTLPIAAFLQMGTAPEVTLDIDVTRHDHVTGLAFKDQNGVTRLRVDIANNKVRHLVEALIATARKTPPC